MCPRLRDTVPTSGTTPYDVRDVISEVVDDGDFMEVHEQWDTNVLCAFARLDGTVVGIVANQPSVKAGGSEQ